MRNQAQERCCAPVFIATLFTRHGIKNIKCPPTDEWIKIWYKHIMECYSAIKKNEIMPFAATQMDLEIIRLREVSQTEKDKYRMISLMCTHRHIRVESTRWHKWTQLWNRSRLTDLENELRLLEGKDGRKGWLGSVRWTRPHCYT